MAKKKRNPPPASGVTPAPRPVQAAAAPSPHVAQGAPLKALIFDSWYDAYRGVIILTRVLDGVIKPGLKIKLMAKGQEYEVEQVGTFSPKPTVATELGVGEVGFVFAAIRLIRPSTPMKIMSSGR